ncbi:MAG: mdlC 2 [Enterovirga sp.]|nr:mdlC 2 [Enterovirga sp.]
MTGRTSVRQATMDLLRGHGMTTVFGNPGSTELPFLGDWPNDFRYILGLQESSAVAMADGFARATGNAAFVNLHSAVGVGHAAGSIFTAFRNATPLVITAGQQARSLLPMQPFLGATDAASFPKPYVKWSCEPARAEDVPAALARAYHLAMQRPCGPTFVSVPMDDWAVETAPVPVREVSRDTAPDPALLAGVAAALDRAERPVFVIGPEVDAEGAGPDTVALVEKTGAAVLTSPFSSRLSFPEDHPAFAGFLPAAPDAIAAALASYDVVVVLGAPVFTFHVVGNYAAFDPGRPLVQLTADPEAAAAALVGASVVGSLRLAVPALTSLVATSARVPEGRPPREVPRATDPLLAEFLMHVLGTAMPAGGILVEEAPSHRPAMQAHLPIRRWGGFYTMASGGLGYSLPAAVGIALAKPERPVTCLIGDGSLMYSVQALWTAVQHRTRLVTVVVNNGGYGAMRSFSRVLKVRNPPGIDLPGLDFVTVAAGMGCPGRRVDNGRDLEAALAEAYAADGPRLVEVIVDPAIPKLYDEH